MLDVAARARAGAITRHVLVFGLLLALFFLLITQHVSREPYVYDEADYMYAASLGFAANWSDHASIPVRDFVRAGLNRDSRQDLSQKIRGGHDALFYRHFHGPLFHYLLIPLSRFGLSEHAVRAIMLAIPAVSLAVIYFGCLWLFSGPESSATALLAAMLFLSSYSVIRSTELAPHQLFALCTLSSLVLLLKAVSTGDRRYWYCAVAMAGLSFCTLEIAFVLLLTLATCCLVERRRWSVDAGFVAKSLGVFLVTVLAIWPSSIFRLSFAKAYAAMAYLAWTREIPWGDTSLLETWHARLAAAPIEWGLIFASLIVSPLLCVRLRNTGMLAIYPVGIFCLLMLITTLRVITLTPRYSLAFVPALDLLAGLTLVPFLGPLRRPASFAVVALAIAGLYGEACYQAVREPRNPYPRSAAVLSFIYQNGLKNKAMLVPQSDLPTLHYYFPGMRLRGYYGQDIQTAGPQSFAADAILEAGDPVLILLTHESAR